MGGSESLNEAWPAPAQIFVRRFSFNLNQPRAFFGSESKSVCFISHDELAAAL